LNAVDEYVKLNNAEEQLEKAQVIVDTFVRNSSVHEVNVDNYSRDEVIQAATQNNMQLNRYLFAPITKIIVRELKEDVSKSLITMLTL
jgi:hypothetical protein